jgi:hypothetical protein
MSKKSRVGRSGLIFYLFFFILLSTKPEIVVPGSGIRFRYLIIENSGKMTKIFKVSTNQNTLLALAISDLLQNNKSGIGPSKEHSNNAKYSICRVVSHKKVFE